MVQNRDNILLNKKSPKQTAQLLRTCEENADGEMVKDYADMGSTKATPYLMKEGIKPCGR